MIKKYLTLFLFLFFIFANIPSVNSNCDCQIWENEYGNLEVCPIISANFRIQKQFWNFSSFITAEIDLAFRFDYKLSYGGVYYWNSNTKKYVKLDVEYVEHNNYHYYLFLGLNVLENKNYSGFIEYETPLNTSGKWDMFVKKTTDPFGNWRLHLDPYYNSQYVNRFDLWVNNTYIDSELTNFPVRVNIQGSNELNDNTQPDLDDIIFVDTTNNTLLDYELDNYTKSGGKLWANYWVKLTSIASDTKTHFNLYYNNPDATNQSNPTGVWDSNYMAVWHCNDIKDSTSNNIDLSNNGATLVSGKIGKCYDFEKGDTDDYLYHTTFLDVIPVSDELTFEAYVNFESEDGNDMTIISKSNIPAEDRFQLRKSGGDKYEEFFMETQNGGSKLATGNTAMDNAIWYYMSGVYDSGNPLIVYKDSTKTTGNTVGVLQDGVDSDFFIGKWHTTNTVDMDGLIDEIRISNTVRNDAWLKASYSTIYYDYNAISPFIIWGQKHTYKCNISMNNIYPVNNSYFCGNVDILTNISIYVCQVDGLPFNITINFLNVNYSWLNVYNNTFSINITNILIMIPPSYPVNYSWHVSIYDGFVFMNASFNFSMCYDALIYLNLKGGDDIITFDITQFSLVIEILMFVIFLWIGFTIESKYEASTKAKQWRYIPFSGGLFLLFASVCLIGMGATLSTYLNEYFAGFIVIAGLVLCFYSIIKAFYYAD